MISSRAILTVSLTILVPVDFPIVLMVSIIHILFFFFAVGLFGNLELGFLLSFFLSSH